MHAVDEAGVKFETFLGFSLSSMKLMSSPRSLLGYTWLYLALVLRFALRTEARGRPVYQRSRRRAMESRRSLQ